MGACKRTARGGTGKCWCGREKGGEITGDWGVRDPEFDTELGSRRFWIWRGEEGAGSFSRGDPGPGGSSSRKAIT